MYSILANFCEKFPVNFFFTFLSFLFPPKTDMKQLDHHAKFSSKWFTVIKSIAKLAMSWIYSIIVSIQQLLLHIRIASIEEMGILAEGIESNKNVTGKPYMTERRRSRKGGSSALRN